MHPTVIQEASRRKQVHALTDLVGPTRVTGNVSANRGDVGEYTILLSAAVVGTAAGWALGNRIASEALRRVFAWSIIGLGAFVVIKNLLGHHFA
jgi:uncharacterized membrane protein YfcA